MNRLLLIVLLFVFVWYVWWRVRRRFAELSARYGRRPQQPADHGKENGSVDLGEGPGHRGLSPTQGLSGFLRFA